VSPGALRWQPYGMSSPLRELDHRTSDGIDVRLLWNPDEDRVHVAVTDAKTGDAFVIPVAPDQRAYDVFHHPFAYTPAPDGREPTWGDLTRAGS
jgi:hypothetical protein